MDLKFIFLGLFIMFSVKTFCQYKDTALYVDSYGDSLLIYSDNIPKNKFWGNSWNASVGYNIAKSNELKISIGRTYGIEKFIKGYDRVHMSSWGINYSILNKSKLLGVYAEHSKFDFVLPLTQRVDFFYDIKGKETYFRPSLGLHLFVVDLLYNYTFSLSNKENQYKHGFTIVLRWCFNKDNWERVYSD